MATDDHRTTPYHPARALGSSRTKANDASAGNEAFDVHVFDFPASPTRGPLARPTKRGAVFSRTGDGVRSAACRLRTRAAAMGGHHARSGFEQAFGRRTARSARGKGGLAARDFSLQIGNARLQIADGKVVEIRLAQISKGDVRRAAGFKIVHGQAPRKSSDDSLTGLRGARKSPERGAQSALQKGCPDKTGHREKICTRPDFAYDTRNNKDARNNKHEGKAA